MTYQINVVKILMDIFEILSQNWIGSLIGIIGLLAAAYYYHKSRIGARLVYQINTLKIIGKDERIIPDDVRIYFRDTPVDRLVKNKIIIWNSGYTTFEGSNIISSNPLRAEYGTGTCVMRASLVKSSRPENCAQAIIHPNNRNEVVFSFNYLDPADGAVIEVYHNGEDVLPKMIGTIKGHPKGIGYWGLIKVPKKEIPLKIKNPVITIIVALGAAFLIFVFIFFIVFLVYTSIIGLLNGIPKGEYSSAIFLLVPIFPLYLFYDYWSERRKFPKSLMTDK